MPATNITDLIKEMSEYMSLQSTSEHGIIVIKYADFAGLMERIGESELQDWINEQRFAKEAPTAGNTAAFRKWVALSRKSKKWDQQELGIRVSLSQGSISRFESGARDFNEDKLIEIRSVLTL